MRVVPVSDLRAVLEEFGGSAQLARDIIYLSARGMRIRFAGKGVRISTRQVDRLTNLGLDYVFLKDPSWDGDVELLVDEDSRVALRSLLEDLSTRCEVVLEIYLQEKGEGAKLDYSFRDFWQRFSNIPLATLHKYRKTIQDLVYIIRANYTQKRVSPLPLPYTDDTFRVAHSVNVAILSGIIALHYGEFNAERMFHIVAGALLSDVGFVDSAWKRSSSRSQEFFFRHPRIGCMLINETDTFSPQMGIIALEHHRYINNTGYPDDIPEKDFYGYPRQMHLYSRIVSVAETFETLRFFFGPERALEAMKKFVGTLFEAKPIDLLERYISLYYLGERIRIASGEVGVVIGAKPGGYEVLLVEDSNGSRMEPKVVTMERPNAIPWPEMKSEKEKFREKVLELVSPKILSALEGVVNDE